MSSKDTTDNFMPGIAGFNTKLDKYVIVATKDNRTIRGLLRSYDHFGNLFMEFCEEICFANEYFAINPIGTIIIRSTNIVCFGTMKDDAIVSGTQVPIEEFATYQQKAFEQDTDANPSTMTSPSAQLNSMMFDF